MAEVVRGVSALQSELEKTRESLKDVDESIKKLTGRDPTETRSIRRVSAVTDRSGREHILLQARWGEEGSPTKRRGYGGAFSRLGPAPRNPGRIRRGGQESGDEDELPNKPAIQSSVTATQSVRSRKDSIEEQMSDRKGADRNKRMFGLLLGTLRKFKDEANDHKDKEDLRKQVEQKLENKAKAEKEELRLERQQLFKERRDKKARIRRLEYKMELVELFEAWEKETRKLENFAYTKAKPHIFYLPKPGSPSLDSKLKETTSFVGEMIAERQKKLEKEVNNLMSEGRMEELGEDEDEEEEEENGEAKKHAQINKENMHHHHHHRRSGGDGELKSNDRHMGDGDRRKRRKSEGNDEERHGGKHRRRSHEDGREKHRSGGRRDHGRREGERGKGEPKVEISYNDGEDDDEEAAKSAKTVEAENESDQVKDVKESDKEKPDIPQESNVDSEVRRRQVILAEDAEEVEDEENKDEADE